MLPYLNYTCSMCDKVIQNVIESWNFMYKNNEIKINEI